MFLDGHAHTHAPQSLAHALPLPLSRFLPLIKPHGTVDVGGSSWNVY